MERDTRARVCARARRGILVRTTLMPATAAAAGGGGRAKKNRQPCSYVFSGDHFEMNLHNGPPSIFFSTVYHRPCPPPTPCVYNVVPRKRVISEIGNTNDDDDDATQTICFIRNDEKRGANIL